METRIDQTRIDQKNVAPGVINAMLGLEKYLSQSSIPRALFNLIYLRASQINGCAYCIDMHWKDLRAGGESEQRLYGLDAWARVALLHRPRARRPRVDRGGHAHRRRARARRRVRRGTARISPRRSSPT